MYTMRRIGNKIVPCMGFKPNEQVLAAFAIKATTKKE
jgi:hypothetical protein